MRPKIFNLFLCVILCSSCDSYFKKLDGIDYSVGWINMPELTSVCYIYPDTDGLVGITEGRITDVYWNKQYILAKQCEFYNDSIKGYYIIKILPPVKKGVPYKKIGPLSEEEFIRLKEELGLNEEEMKHLNLFKNRIFWIW